MLVVSEKRCGIAPFFLWDKGLVFRGFAGYGVATKNVRFCSVSRLKIRPLILLRKFLVKKPGQKRTFLVAFQMQGNPGKKGKFMLSKRIVSTGIVISVMAVYAVGYGAANASQVITSKTYVDAQLASKQNIIPAAGENTADAGESVVMYTDTAGTIGERAIFDLDNDYDYDNHGVYEGHEDDLVPATAYQYLEDWAGVIAGNVDNMQGDIDDMVVPDLANLNQTTIITKTCVEWVSGAAQTDANCLLWDLTDTTAYACVINGNPCNTNGECCSNNCDDGTCAAQ